MGATTKKDLNGKTPLNSGVGDFKSPSAPVEAIKAVIAKNSVALWNKDEYADTFNRLPLHNGMMYKAPSEVIEALLNPDEKKEKAKNVAGQKDRYGMTPLNLGLQHNA